MTEKNSPSILKFYDHEAFSNSDRAKSNVEYCTTFSWILLIFFFRHNHAKTCDIFTHTGELGCKYLYPPEAQERCLYTIPLVLFH